MNQTFIPPILCDRSGDLSKPWFVYYYLDGKRKRVYGSINKNKNASERRKTAQDICEQIIKKQQLRYKSETQKKVDAWLETRAQHWRKKTFMDHKSKVDALFLWLGFEQLNNKNLRAFFLTIMESKSATTYNNYRVVLKHILSEVLELNSLQTVELFFGIKPLKAHASPLFPFPTSIMARLKDKILEDEPHLWLVCQLQYYCFIRPGEIRGLKVSDVMLEDDKIMVHSSISKNRKTRFPIIPPIFKEELENAIKNKHLGEYLCPSTQGKMIQAGVNQYARFHTKIMKEIGLDDSRYKLYSWKPSGMLHAIKNGASIKFLKEQAGHASIDQTDSYLRAVGWRDDDNSSKLFPKI